MNTSVTHGITAVAELKPEHAQVSRQQLGEVTHGITAVAELKQPRPQPAGPGRGVTHGITAVAELKPDAGSAEE